MEHLTLIKKKYLTATILILITVAVPLFAAGLKKGANAPDFSITLSDGKNAGLSDYRGKVLILHFWATWCGPCRSELPLINSMAKQLDSAKDAGLSLLAVCVSDSEKNYTNFMQQNGYTFRGGLDEPGDIASKYGVYAIPTSVIISADGKIIEIITGAMPEAKISSLLKKYAGL